MKAVNLLEDNYRRVFFHYLVPSISATFVTSIYILADSIIIGKGIGADGIAALNLILPTFSLFFGIGLLFGVGGGVLMSVANGSGQREKANHYFTASVVGGLLVSLLMTVVCFLFFESILNFLGAEKVNKIYVTEYIQYIFTFCPIFVFSTLLQALVRNDHAPKTAMFAVISGGVSNIILDCYFIYVLHMGMAGGAIATVIGSSVTVGILLSHFRSKQNTMRLILHKKAVAELPAIIKCGFSSFIMDFANGVVMLVFNLQILRYLGDIGVVVYSIVTNSNIIAVSLFNGVSQAAQPIMASNYGAGFGRRVEGVRKMGLASVALAGFVLFLIGGLLPGTIIVVFVHATAEIFRMGIPAVRIYFAAFLASGCNIFFIHYFQSVVKLKEAFLISLFRGICFSTLFAHLFPILFGKEMIWFAVPVAEFVTLGIAFLFFCRIKPHTVV